MQLCNSFLRVYLQDFVWSIEQLVFTRLSSNDNVTILELGARMLLGAPGLTTRNKKLLGLLASLLGARTLLGASLPSFNTAPLSSETLIRLPCFQNIVTTFSICLFKELETAPSMNTVLKPAFL